MASIIKQALGLGPKVRYAVVGLGDISQRAFMPGVKHTGNSEMVALVTGDPKKAEDLCKKYSIKDSYSYEQFDQLIQSKTIDAIYLATPNWRHAEFAVPALKAGIHVLLEKPMEVTVEKCEEILAAQKTSNAKLMIAYRLHFEPATISAVEKVRAGEIGTPLMFSSTFSQPLDPKNHRGQNGVKGGPLFDMGTYPLNAVRNLYGTEPLEVFAFGTRHPESGFSQDFDDTVAVNLVFPDNKLAQFTVSYFGNGVNDYTIVGTKGSIRLDPGYMYDSGLEFKPIQIGEKPKNEKFKHTDHFGGQLKYFSDCILKNEEVEPDGEEGLLDIRVLVAAVKSLETKSVQKLEPRKRSKQITSAQEQTLGAVSQPSASEETNAKPPAK